MCAAERVVVASLSIAVVRSVERDFGVSFLFTVSCLAVTRKVGGKERRVRESEKKKLDPFPAAAFRTTTSPVVSDYVRAKREKTQGKEPADPIRSVAAGRSGEKKRRGEWDEIGWRMSQDQSVRRAAEKPITASNEKGKVGREGERETGKR